MAGTKHSMAKWRVEDCMETFTKIQDLFVESAFSKDGTLSCEQLTFILQSLDPGFTEDKVKRLFDTVDKDGSGSIDFQELLRYVFDFDTAEALAQEHATGLTPAAVYCRLRPSGGSGHGHGAGEAVEKSLDGFTEASIFVKDRHSRVEYTFPTAVFTPDRTQEEVFETMMPDMIDAWMMKSYNVMCLAYGQTGTGKTHTMFGPRESLLSREASPDWGVFPRVVHTCLRRMDAVVKMMPSCTWCLTASAVEFYMTQCFDLLLGGGPLLLDADGMPVGASQLKLTQVSDVAHFLDEVARHRHVSKTKMNAGSSRSHCAMLLTLHQTDMKAQGGAIYGKTVFSLVDMAGSERVTKTGAAFVAPTQVMNLLQNSKGLTKEQEMGAEGGMINFELSLLRDEVAKATEQHARKQRYTTLKRGSTDAIRFLSNCLTGQALPSMIVCLSQSPQHGWETWFSCQYAESLAKLKVPLQKGKIEKFDKVHKRAVEAMKRARKVFDETPEKGSPSSKYWTLRKGQALGAARYVEILDELAAQGV